MRPRQIGWAVALLIGVGECLGGGATVRRPLGLIEVDLPRNPPMTSELVALGTRLFFDRSLSRSGQTSCASCHDPAFGFAEPRATSVGDGGIVQARNAPSLYNVGYLPTVMWDGQFRTLEQQALDPFKVGGDMGIDVEEAVRRAGSDATYRGMFQLAFGGDATADRMAMAIAAYERTLVSGDSPFDRYLFGGDTRALNDDQRRGLDVFSTRAGCLNCHDVFHPRFNPLGGGNAMFTDFRFHNLGVGFVGGRFADSGRMQWSRAGEDLASFRTPSLRNVKLTAPYMHDGSLATLEDVVDFYDRGGNANGNLSPSIRALFLSPEEKRLLVVFLESLTDPLAEELARASPAQRRPNPLPVFATKPQPR